MYRADSIDTPFPAHLTAASAVRLRPTLLALSSAYPPFEVTKQQSWDRFFHQMSQSVPFAKRIIDSTGVQKRHIMWDLDTLPEVCAMLTGDRLAAHATAVIEVGSRSLKQA